jgi:hypothetical protein
MAAPEFKSAEARFSGCAPLVGLCLVLVVDVVASAGAGSSGCEDGCSFAIERSHHHTALVVAVIGAVAIIAGAAALNRGKRMLIWLLVGAGVLLLISGAVIYEAASFSF